MADHIDPSTLSKPAAPVAKSDPAPVARNPLENLAAPKVNFTCHR
jgi:hypothetical protein